MDKKLKELSEDSPGFNFVSLYLKEVEKDNSNGGTLDNRSVKRVGLSSITQLVIIRKCSLQD